MTEEDNKWPDYATFPIPEKPKTEFTTDERRSQIYNWIEQVGHPRNLERTQTEIGKQFGVSQTQIHKDIKAIKESKAERVGKDAEAKTELICETAVRKLMEEEEYQKAAKLQLDYFGWLFDSGEREKEPEKHNVSMQDAWKQALDNE